MLKNIKQVRKFISDEKGATVVEYGVLIALVIAACIAIIFILGGQISEGFRAFSQSLKDAGMS